MSRRFAALLPLAVLAGLAAALGAWWALRLVGPQPRVVDASRVEHCLQAFIAFRKSGDDLRLQEDLRQANIPRAEFEKVIDRFVHYRISKSSLDQAKKLLEVFKEGYNIYPEKVVETTRPASPALSFQLDAEVLTIFTEKPELVREAFGS
ncbi:MAG: hypothetical protein GX442_02310 [Candidatus Riflebacteria bacterium]|nr:hypothetical protein [Candidatus Riflebacteria bacterium]